MISPTPNPAPITIPHIRSWTGHHGTWALTAQTRLVVDQEKDPELLPAAALVANELARQEGVRPAVATDEPRKDDIRLRLRSDLSHETGAEGYRLDIADVVTISAARRAGIFYGTRTLLQALRTTAAPGAVGQGTAHDSPMFEDRGQMLDVGRKYFPIDYLKHQIRQMSWYKLNTLHLHMTDWNGYRVESDLYPEIVSPEHYTKAELRELEEYAARYSVTIVPEIDLPGHAVAISAARPDLAFKCPSMSRPATSWEGASVGGWTLDFTKPEVREFSRRLVTELADVFDSPYIHIGVDEVPRVDAQDCPELVDYQRKKHYPFVGDVLVDYIVELDAAVHAAGKTTQIWQWWDYQQETSIAPPDRVIVHEWLNNPEARAKSGHPTIGVQGEHLYVTPGFGAHPGADGFFDLDSTYREYPFAENPGVRGYHLARWADCAADRPVGWHDYFARRPLAVVADRTWGSPGSDIRTFLDHYDQVGDALPVGVPGPVDLATQVGVSTGMLTHDGWTARASCSDHDSECSQATAVIDKDPHTHWRSCRSHPMPHQIEIDLGQEQHIAGLRYMPRQDGFSDGNAKDFEVLVSGDGSRWKTLVRGAFGADPVEYVVPLPVTSTRHIALRALSEHGGGNEFVVSEIDIVRARLERCA